jgi:septin family protein
VGILVSAGVAGCAANKPAPPVAPTIVARDAAVATILACIEEHRDLSRQDQRTAYAELEPQAASGTEADRLRLACLGLHERAMVRQLRRSIELVEAETEARPDEAASLNGLLALLQRLERERVARWVQQRKESERRKSLAAEKAQLSERLTLLEQQAEQDRVRIEELQKQIEQLKNIETIIKIRER